MRKITFIFIFLLFINSNAKAFLSINFGYLLGYQAGFGASLSKDTDIYVNAEIDILLLGAGVDFGYENIKVNRNDEIRYQSSPYLNTYLTLRLPTEYFDVYYSPGILMRGGRCGCADFSQKFGVRFLFSKSYVIGAGYKIMGSSNSENKVKNETIFIHFNFFFS